MSQNPLAPPRDDRLLNAFLRHFQLSRAASPPRWLRDVAAAFARLPYENLTKIIREAETGSPAEARRGPADVLRDHFALGTGGTCFSLTATLLHLVRALGWRAEPILADRRYGPNTHCALVVWIDSRPHLLDPGFLIVDPIPLDGTARPVNTAFNQLLLSPQAAGDKIDLHTRDASGQQYRLTFKCSPVEPAEFLRVWDASFDWDMMRYPLLTRVVGQEHLYLRGNYFQARGGPAVRRAELPPDELAARIASLFHIDSTIAARALSILNRKGESIGSV